MKSEDIIVTVLVVVSIILLLLLLLGLSIWNLLSNRGGGTKILTGDIDPTKNDGNNGDFFINLITNTFFGPKTDDEWPVPGVPLVGPVGPSGGTSSILNGTVDPTTEGVDGDFYINTTTNEIFGPKDSGVWPTPGVSLIGPAGSAGPPGINGSTGAAGTDGATIVYGTVDPTVTEGNDGDFYIRTDTNFIFGPKTAGVWPAGVSIVGPAGTNGVDGSTIVYGTVDPTVTEGNDGDFYIRTDTNFIFGPKTAGVWPTGVSLVGPAGTNGTNGTNGIDADPEKIMWFSLFPDQSGSSTEIFATGINQVIGTGVTANVASTFFIQNNHLYITVNSVTTGGNIRITGTSIDETTAVPILGDIEDILIDTTTNQVYQSIKKWISITEIDIGFDTITGLNYDYGSLGYTDFGNTDFKIKGYRLEAQHDGNGTLDLDLLIRKVDSTGNKVNIVDIENITVNSTGSGGNIVDTVRSGARNYTVPGTPGPLWPAGLTWIFKQGDFDTYFTGGENIIQAASNEGIIIKLNSSALGAPNGVRYARLQVRYEKLP